MTNCTCRCRDSSTICAHRDIIFSITLSTIECLVRLVCGRSELVCYFSCTSESCILILNLILDNINKFRVECTSYYQIVELTCCTCLGSITYLNMELVEACGVCVCLMPSSSLLVSVLDGCSWCIVNLRSCPRQLHINVLQSSCCSLRSELNPYSDYIAILLQQLISLVFCNSPLQDISLVTANSICCANYGTYAWCKYVEAVLSVRLILDTIYEFIVSLEFRLTHVNLSENLALNLIPSDSLYLIQNISCTTYSIVFLDTIRFNSFRSCIYICNFNLDVTNRSNSIT